MRTSIRRIVAPLALVAAATLTLGACAEESPAEDVDKEITQDVTDGEDEDDDDSGNEDDENDDDDDEGDTKS